jgi:hypothetical protein
VSPLGSASWTGRNRSCGCSPFVVGGRQLVDLLLAPPGRPGHRHQKVVAQPRPITATRANVGGLWSSRAAPRSRPTSFPVRRVTTSCQKTRLNIVPLDQVALGPGFAAESSVPYRRRNLHRPTCACRCGRRRLAEVRFVRRWSGPKRPSARLNLGKRLIWGSVQIQSPRLDKTRGPSASMSKGFLHRMTAIHFHWR